jgi:hypothetical protein
VLLLYLLPCWHNSPQNQLWNFLRLKFVQVVSLPEEVKASLSYNTAKGWCWACTSCPSGPVLALQNWVRDIVFLLPDTDIVVWCWISWNVAYSLAVCFSYDHGVLDALQFRWQCINLGFCFNRDIFISSKGSRLKSLLKEAAWLLTLPTCVLGLTCSLAHLVLHLSWARTHPLYLLFTRWVFFHITPLVFCESYKF